MGSVVVVVVVVVLLEPPCRINKISIWWHEGWDALVMPCSTKTKLLVLEIVNSLVF